MRHRFRRNPTAAIITLALLVVLATALAACGSESSTTTTAVTSTSTVASPGTTAAPTTQASVATTSGKPQELLVSAAAGLKTAFTKMGEVFDQQNNAKTTFNFAASGVLQKQIEGGAPADVFASADPKQMNALVKESLADTSSVQTFASNEIVLIVPADSTLGIGSSRTSPRPPSRKWSPATRTPLLSAWPRSRSYRRSTSRTRQSPSSSTRRRSTRPSSTSKRRGRRGHRSTSEALAGGEKVKVVATADPSWYGGKAEFVMGEGHREYEQGSGPSFHRLRAEPDGSGDAEGYGFLPPPAK